MDINELLSSLSDKDMATLKNLASSLSSNQAQEPAAKSTGASTPQGSENPLGSIDLNSLGSIASLMSRFSNSASDPRCNLILSLKPMLSPERQQRADEAIKIIKLIDMLPALRDSGLLKGVF